MSKQTIKLSESKLRTLVESTVRDVLKESFLSKMGDKVNDFMKGYPTKEGNPTSEEDVFEGDGWKILKVKQLPNGKEFYVRRTSGGMGEFYGKEIEEMVEELNIFLNGNGTAQYVGKYEKKPGIEKFQINY